VSDGVTLPHLWTYLR